jgi:hypothetical protein
MANLAGINDLVMPAANVLQYRFFRLMPYCLAALRFAALKVPQGNRAPEWMAMSQVSIAPLLCDWHRTELMAPVKANSLVAHDDRVSLLVPRTANNHVNNLSPRQAKATAKQIAVCDPWGAINPAAVHICA